MGPETPTCTCIYRAVNSKILLLLKMVNYKEWPTFISLTNSAAIDSQNAQLHVNKKIGFTYMVLKQRIRFLVSV